MPADERTRWMIQILRTLANQGIIIAAGTALGGFLLGPPGLALGSALGLLGAYREGAPAAPNSVSASSWSTILQIAINVGIQFGITYRDRIIEFARMIYTIIIRLFNRRNALEPLQLSGFYPILDAPRINEPQEIS